LLIADFLIDDCQLAIPDLETGALFNRQLAIGNQSAIINQQC